MSGDNQHHIPQFVQRGFGVPRSGKPKEIWIYARDSAPDLGLIKRTAADHHFYSPPSADGAATLDDKITDIEIELSRKLSDLRALHAGTNVNPAVASEIISHLAPRAAHIRFAFAKGMRAMMAGVRETIADKANLAHALGIDGEAPTARFDGHVTPMLRNDSRFAVLALLGLPEPLLKLILFQFAKENFDRIYERRSASLDDTLEDWDERSDEEAKRGHNDALARIIDESVRRPDLEAMTWTIEAAPAEGAVLPDCVAIVVQKDESTLPFMMSSKTEVAAVVMPISRQSLLVGRSRDAASVVIADFNQRAASASHSFFLAHREGEGLATLCEAIGTRSTIVIEEVLDRVMGEFRAPARNDVASTGHEQSATEPSASTSTNFSYGVGFDGFGDETLLETVCARLKGVVGPLSEVLPLDRLDGVTFTNDVPASAAAIDIGVGSGKPRSPERSELGVTVAKNVLVMRDGVVKAHVFIAGGFVEALVDEQHPSADFVLHSLIAQLAEVAGTAWFDHCVPGVLMRPLADEYDASLLNWTLAAADGYPAARFAAPFDDGTHAEMLREMLISSFGLAKSMVAPARLAYRDHADLRQLFYEIATALSPVLNLAAKLHGHCDGAGLSPFDEEGNLEKALDEFGLSGWFSSFRLDLERHWARRGHWKSLTDFHVFNRHLERLFWPFGIFCWVQEDGQRRIEVPLVFDAGALIEAAAKGREQTGEAGESTASDSSSGVGGL